jgi:hypothetical protein
MCDRPGATAVSQSGATGDRADWAALTAQATTDLERASSAGDLQGVANALALFERVEDAARRQGHPEHLTSVINLANALIAGAELARQSIVGTLSRSST